MEEDNNGYVVFLNIDPRISWEKRWLKGVLVFDDPSQKRPL